MTQCVACLPKVKPSTKTVPPRTNHCASRAKRVAGVSKLMNKWTSRRNPIKNCVYSRVHHAACWIGDRITDWTGYAGAKIPLQRAKGQKEVTLDLPGYMQLNSYCCGAVTVAMVVKYFRPRMSFGQIYASVNPSPECGAGRTAVARALRTCGVRASRQHKLTFERLCSAIDQSRPVLVAIHNPGAEVDHWIRRSFRPSNMSTPC